MLEISSVEFISFLRQLGLAISGAACLWGLYFHWKSKRSEDREEFGVFRKTSRHMIHLFVVGLLISTVGWGLFLSEFPNIVFAHEGVSLVPETAGMKEAMSIFSPLFFAFVGIALAGLIYKLFDKEHFHKHLPWFYGVEFVVVFILISFPTWTGGFGSEQWFFAGHSFHSIFTVGTVIALDFMFILTKLSNVFEKYIYSVLPTVSKVIWVGLAVDFVSVALIFDPALLMSSKFVFMQAVIGIIIINGVLLSGPVTERLLASVRETPYILSDKWNRIAVISGALSISSWLTVTFVDTLHEINIDLWQMFGWYALFVLAVYLVYEAVEHYALTYERS